MQLELFELRPSDLPMRMILDTIDVELMGKSPDEAMAAINEAKAKLPEGSSEPFFEIKGGPDDLHRVCRLVFRRPATPEERATAARYPRLKVVAA